MKALITGASSGLGRDMAKSLARRGWDLILVARREDRLCELAAQLPTQAEIIPLDLSVQGNCRALYEQVRDQELDLLVNNAGFGVFGAFDETDLSAELNMLSVNIRATHILMKLFLPDFKARNRGRILNVASAAAFTPGPLFSSYYASKAYVLRLTQAVAEELRRVKSAVTVSVLCPGPVHTEFGGVAGVAFKGPSLRSPDVAEYAIRSTLSGRLVIVPGVQMKFVHVARRLVPDKLLARAVYQIQHRKTDLK